ncbi:MAG: phosphate propanoyltransferase [Caldiserica bacterium]|nr:MAG: phosphate propanoyltransferase [Caldisericota bacterium]
MKEITDEILERIERSKKPIICNVSARHMHLTQEALEILFGPGYKLRKLRDLIQPGEFASREKVTIVGPKGKIEKVRVLGPTRKYCQVEVSRTDCFILGVQAPVRDSGDIKGSAPIKVIGPYGEVDLKEGLIVARRHIHMTPEDAEEFKVKDKQFVRIYLPTAGRKVILEDTLIRVSTKYALECHIDTDEANSADFKSGGYVYIV